MDKKKILHDIYCFLRREGLDDKSLADLGWNCESWERIEMFAFLIEEACERQEDRGAKELK